MINRKAYFLKKGDKKMSKFFFSQLELQEKYSEKLKQDGYTIGVMQYSHIEEKDEVEYVILWTDNYGLDYNKQGTHFYANYETCWGEIPERWHTKIEVDKRDIIEHNDRTVKVVPKARIRNLGQYTATDIFKLKRRYRNDFLETLKPFMVGENRVRLYVNPAGEDLIRSGWHGVGCYFLLEGAEPRIGHYLVEADVDKIKAGWNKGDVRADGTHHIKIIKKIVDKKEK